MNRGVLRSFLETPGRRIARLSNGEGGELTSSVEADGMLRLIWAIHGEARCETWTLADDRAVKQVESADSIIIADIDGDLFRIS